MISNQQIEFKKMDIKENLLSDLSIKMSVQPLKYLNSFKCFIQSSFYVFILKFWAE